MNTTKQPISVFYSYDEADKDLRDELNKHLKMLEHQQLISQWHDQNIRIGTDRNSAINEHLETAQIILLLISADFIASDYRYSNEMQRALERHKRGEAFVIPVWLRDCDISGRPFDQLDFLPSNGKSVTSDKDKIDEAFKEVAKGIRQVVEELLPRTKEQWLDEGNRLHRAKNYEKALVAYERALRLDPRYARAQRNKGDALYSLKRHEEAFKAYTIALQLDPNSARAQRNMADVLWHLKQYNEAIDAYENAIRLAPTPQLHNEKGDALFRLGRYGEALWAYEQAISLDANFANAHNNKGTALLRMKRYQDAIAAYEQAIKLEPNFALAYQNKGRALFHLGRYQDSLTAYECAIELDPKFAAAHANYADTLDKLGRLQEAAEARAKADKLKKAK